MDIHKNARLTPHGRELGPSTHRRAMAAAPRYSALSLPILLLALSNEKIMPVLAPDNSSVGVVDRFSGNFTKALYLRFPA